jgi:hypothetical protein
MPEVSVAAAAAKDGNREKDVSSSADSLATSSGGGQLAVKMNAGE